MSQQLENSADLLRAIGNPVRIFILNQLAKAGEKTVNEMRSELPELFAVSQSSFSQHLSHLRKFDLVVFRKEGLYVYYSVNNEQMEKVQEVLDGLKVAA